MYYSSLPVAIAAEYLLSLSLCPLKMAATVDLFPTFAAVAGAALPRGVILDGLDMSPLLFHNQPVNSDVTLSEGYTRP